MLQVYNDLYRCFKTDGRVGIHHAKKTINENGNTIYFYDCTRCGGTRKIVPHRVCENCEKVVYARSAHDCLTKTCRFCNAEHADDKSRDNHRCPFTAESKNSKKFVADNTTGYPDKRLHRMLYVYDIESLAKFTDFEPVENIVNEDGSFMLLDPIVYKRRNSLQVPCFIYVRNVLNPDEPPRHFTTIDAFTEWTLLPMHANSTFIAHNGSGYDSRLVYDCLVSKRGIRYEKKPTVIVKGSKILQIRCGRTEFNDSFRHLTASLNSLAKSFGFTTLKGYFPHLFHIKANETYNGPLPDKKYFDVGFLKSQQDLDDFNKWHDVRSLQGDWNLHDELVKYCINDVDILAKVVLIYHTELMASIGEYYPNSAFSPWLYPTLAGYVHAVNIAEYVNSRMDYWVTQTRGEYYYARMAMRGGMTKMCLFYCDKPMKYVDIQSSYPSVMLNKKCLYPTGIPKVMLFDLNFYPCVFCTDIHKCRNGVCSISSRRKKRDVRMSITECSPIALDQCNDFLCHMFYTLDDAYDRYSKGLSVNGGIITVDVSTPKDLYHPLFGYIDSKTKSTCYTCEDLKMYTTTTVELMEMINVGCKVTKIYRIDSYVMKSSPYRDLPLRQMYVNKLKCSFNGGDFAQAEIYDMRKYYQDEYGMELGDMRSWIKNAVLKAVNKGPLTAAWGKQAESTEHSIAKNFGFDDASQELIYNGKKHLKKYQLHENGIQWIYEDDRQYVQPDLTNKFLPYAVFVTAYGRIKLWKELHKLGKRVVMCDTDSIVYIEEDGGYDIPIGKYLGDWEPEYYIQEFIGVSPKFYSLKTIEGKEYMRVKGANIKVGHKHLINHGIFKEMLYDRLVVSLPQFQMKYVFFKGITAFVSIKSLKFNDETLAGLWVDSEKRLYPRGYDL